MTAQKLDIDQSVRSRFMADETKRLMRIVFEIGPSKWQHVINRTALEPSVFKSGLDKVRSPA